MGNAYMDSHTTEVCLGHYAVLVRIRERTFCIGMLHIYSKSSLNHSQPGLKLFIGVHVGSGVFQKNHGLKCGVRSNTTTRWLTRKETSVRACLDLLKNVKLDTLF